MWCLIPAEDRRSLDAATEHVRTVAHDPVTSRADLGRWRALPAPRKPTAKGHGCCLAAATKVHPTHGAPRRLTWSM